MKGRELWGKNETFKSNVLIILGKYLWRQRGDWGGEQFCIRISSFKGFAGMALWKTLVPLLIGKSISH